MRPLLIISLVLLVPSVALPQAESLSPQVRAFVSVDAPLVSLSGMVETPRLQAKQGSV
jgi:hypothetical protein